MPHHVLQLQQGAHVARLGEGEAVCLWSQVCPPPGVSLVRQAQLPSVGRGRIPRGQWIVVDKEAIVDAPRWRVEQPYLAARDDPPVRQVTREDRRDTGRSDFILESISYLEDSLEKNPMHRTDLVELCPNGSGVGERLYDRSLNAEPGPSSYHSSKESDWGHEYGKLQRRKIVYCSEKPEWRVLQRFEEKILFLENYGVDSSKVLTLYPLFGKCSMQNVRGVVAFLEACGLRGKYLARVLTQNPQLLGESVEETLKPAVRFLLQEVRLPEKDVGYVVNRCSRLLLASVDAQLRPTMEYLQSLGFTDMPSVISNNATLLTCSIQNKLIPKLEFLQSIGLSYDDGVRVLVRFPAIFNYSIDSNLRRKHIYLVKVMERGLEDLKAFPQFFGYSLEYRIQPRHQFLEKLNLRLSLANMLKLTDEAFYARFSDAGAPGFQQSIMEVSGETGRIYRSGAM